MKIVIVGAGAMGSVYAALLADSGNEVWAIDLWREHLDAINDHGLQVSGASGERTVSNIQVSTRAADAGPCDLVVIATKARHVADAAAAAKSTRSTIRISISTLSTIGKLFSSLSITRTTTTIIPASSTTGIGRIVSTRTSTPTV